MTSRTTFIALAGALGLTAAAGAASAGGLAEPVATPAPVVAPVAVAPAPVMTGGDWTGFYAGGQLGYGRVTSDALSDTAEGATYGVHAGYDYDFGSLVVGGEVDYDWADIEDEGTGIALDNVARLKLRVGYDAGNFLPYLTGGIAQATTGGALDETDTGAFAGLGVAYKVTDSIRVGGEVLRHEFNDFADSGADIEATTASLRVSYEF